ncbi:MAG: ligase-associated DNA damage response DEXH box helicase [Bernardetiaceae bacterium]|nr:ligase-associated DNA damage response DEXH box helicase [Bernardetiaceae bacterium]
MSTAPPPLPSAAVQARLAAWLAAKGWQLQGFQQACLAAYLAGQSGLLNAPTGSGKTYALWLPILAEWLLAQEGRPAPAPGGLQVLWITPLRALSKDLQTALQRAADELGVPWAVALRTGDTTPSERQKQRKKPPQAFVTTPESLHVLLATQGHPQLLGQVRVVVVDEWHELLGSKRGVQTELLLARLLALNPRLKIWGISATIGNLAQAAEVLVYPLLAAGRLAAPAIVKARLTKQIDIESILPDTIEKFPWAGHLGTNLLYKVLPIVARSRTTLLFTNTRAMTEIWYQKILETEPELAGLMAMHHGSLDLEIRTWVENALHQGKLKLVVCTSSLDLGVDFRPVDTVIQVGSPKGAGRFVQRAGRSGHQPGAASKIYFLPTHSLELIEGAALRQAIAEEQIEERPPLRLAMDVLVQYIVTRAVAEGFYGDELYQEVVSTFCFKDLTPPQWQWALDFTVTGGNSLGSYDEFKKVEIEDREGRLFYLVKKKKTATQHRLSIGTIVSDPAVKVKYLNGGYIGTVEESFISRLNEGDVFWFGGRSLAFVKMHGMEALVRKTTKRANQLPRWGGGRMPLSSHLALLLRQKMQHWQTATEVELTTIEPILELQARWSAVPRLDQLLIESLQTREGYHLFIYPFAGRAVHEVLAALCAYRFGQLQPISFSVAMNDYGFELLSDRPIPLLEALEAGLFSPDDLLPQMAACLNETEMARRKFRDIASIAGLVFQGYPGKGITHKNLYASTRLLFDVFSQYDTQNLLVQQAYQEVLDLQLEMRQVADTLAQINRQEILIKHPPRPTPFAFPILVDRMRDQLTSESLEERVSRMTVQLERDADEY